MRFNRSTSVISAVFFGGILFGVMVTSIGAAFKGSAVFRDVAAGNFADDAIGEMYQLGIIKGLDSAHFGPDQPLTRAQAAVLFKRLRDEIKGISSSSASSSSRSASSVFSSSSSVVSSSQSSSYASIGAGGAVHFNSPGYAVDKNIATGTVDIQVVRTNGNQGAGTVNYSFSGGTAVAGKDYQPIAGTLSFGSKETSKKLSMTIMNNTSVTGDKTVNLVLSKPAGSIVISNPGQVVLTIRDPSVPSSSASSSSSSAFATTVSLSANSYAVAENGGSLNVTIFRSGVTSAATTVSYAAVNGTASAGADYTAVIGTATFAADETSKVINIPVTNNSAIDGARNLSFTLSNPLSGAGLAVASAGISIMDDEVSSFGSGSLKFSSSNFSVTKSQGTAIITVNRVGGITPVSVNYATGNGTGQSGRDYTSVSGTLSFGANEAGKTFTIPIFKPATVSGDLTVNLMLSGPTNGATLIDPSTATLNIYQ